MTELLKVTPEGQIYEVFARFREDGLRHIGSVVARNDELAKMYAAKLYDEWGWREMAIVPRAKITTIIAPV
ncbi:MAG: hypothetical protein H6658_10895 [Ardenticatenaceae bacterium]|nr:hypothetical protein [Ardenticatenaceae bacterium]